MYRSIKWASCAALALLCATNLAQASDTIDPGWDLFETDSGSTTFFGHHFEGVPLGSFNFGGTIGVQNVGPTDTLIRRLEPASVFGPGNSDTILTVVDAFQLRSVDPVSILGGPMGIYYITLASRSGGLVSAGTMTINFGAEGDPHGTFSSSFNLFVDVRFGSLTGPILTNVTVTIPDSGAFAWRHDPTSSIQIPGVNTDLNGLNSDNDFWVEGTVFKKTPNGGISAHPAGVPDTGCSLLFLSTAVTALGCFSMFRKR